MKVKVWRFRTYETLLRDLIFFISKKIASKQPKTQAKLTTWSFASGKEMKNHIKDLKERGRRLIFETEENILLLLLLLLLL